MQLSSQLHDCRVILSSLDASFVIPTEWADHYRARLDNCFFSSIALRNALIGHGHWQTEYASVCNAAFPADRCAAHVGSDSWGAHAASFTGLHIRCYDLPVDAQTVRRMILSAGVTEIQRIAGHLPRIKIDDARDWKRIVLSFGIMYNEDGDAYAGLATLDFSIMPHRHGSIVFIFMYNDSCCCLPAIDSILESWSCSAR
jgi:hypothetical protein